MNFSAADHVEYLHHHKSRENERHMPRGTKLIHLFLGVKRGSVPVLSAARVNVASLPIEHELGLGLWNNILPIEQNKEQDSTLPQSLAQDVLDHFSRHDVVLSILGLALEKLWFRQLCSQGQRS